MYLRDLSMPDILKLFSTEAEKKVYLFRNKKQHYNYHCDFWLGGKICIVKTEKWIVFPESLYVNSNPDYQIDEIKMPK